MACACNGRPTAVEPAAEIADGVVGVGPRVVVVELFGLWELAEPPLGSSFSPPLAAGGSAGRARPAEIPVALSVNPAPTPTRATVTAAATATIRPRNGRVAATINCLILPAALPMIDVIRKPLVGSMPTGDAPP